MKLPQLSLRDLFWLVLVAAILCGWFVHVRTMLWGFEAALEAQSEMYEGLVDALSEELKRAEEVRPYIDTSSPMSTNLPRTSP